MVFDFYKDDIDGELLKEEIAQFLHFCKPETVVNPNDMYSLIHNFDLYSTPTLVLASSCGGLGVYNSIIPHLNSLSCKFVFK